jgi:hypothetical protein
VTLIGTRNRKFLRYPVSGAVNLVYLSSGLHRGGEGSLSDLDWTKRTWDPAKAYAESKLHVVALAFALARRWPQVLSNVGAASDKNDRHPLLVLMPVAQSKEPTCSL